MGFCQEERVPLQFAQDSGFPDSDGPKDFHGGIISDGNGEGGVADGNAQKGAVNPNFMRHEDVVCASDLIKETPEVKESFVVGNTCLIARNTGVELSDGVAVI